jgi:diguanylate cyclase (GGDEF)-like protein
MFPNGQPGPAEVAVWATLALLGASILVYLVLLLVRGPSTYWTWLDGWAVDAVELVAGGICMSRALLRRPGRSAALVLGLSLLSWAAGDVVLTVQSIGGATPPSPSLADVFYVGFYPLAYVGVVLFMRGQSQRINSTNWLDGAIAGLGAAAVCAAFVADGALRPGGATSEATWVNLALPIGDALLLGLVVGGFAVLSGRSKAPWILMAVGMTLNVFGDSSNLLQHSFGSTPLGQVLNAVAWPAAIVLLSMAVWLRPRPPNPMILERPAGFVLPALAAAAALVILFVGTLYPIGRFSLALATTTLLVVGIRLVLSVRSLGLLSQERHRQALTDELTGLWNRRYLFGVLDAFFAGCDGGPDDRSLAFLFVDLDRFKEINDSFGHPAGDELLRQLGARLGSSLRDGDLLVRLGGDEFAVVLADGDAAYAAVVAERLTHCLHEPFALRAVSATIGASIGIAVAPTDATDSARLVWCADVAMYRAKLGHVPYANYTSDLDEEHNQMRLLEELRVAIAEGQLILHYQPQLDLRSHEILAVEALVRWAHPRLGLVPPDDFLPLAQDAGLMEAVTEWVLDAAVTQCVEWRSSGRPFSVAVNVSPSNLLEPGFVRMVGDVLRHRGLTADGLVLEITESCVIAEFATAQRVLEELQALGVAISIDDFGAGVTSLAYLSDLAVHELKLDRTFITRMTEGSGRRDLDLVRSTIELGHAMGLRIVAEGIEDPVTLDLLSDFGCDIAQGYCISRPMPAGELAFRPRVPEELPVGPR